MTNDENLTPATTKTAAAPATPRRVATLDKQYGRQAGFLTKLTTGTGAFNVLDETYGWWSDVRGLSAASTVKDAYTQPGRNFGVSLTLRL